MRQDVPRHPDKNDSFGALLVRCICSVAAARYETIRIRVYVLLLVPAEGDGAWVESPPRCKAMQRSLVDGCTRGREEGAQ